MSDPRHDFEAWLGGELRRPAQLDHGSRARIMQRVRAEARTVERVRAPSRGNRRGWIAGQVGALLAAGVAGILALGTLDRLNGSTASAGGRPVAAASIRDTLRLVRFVLAAPTASSVALVGDFNGWRAGATLLAEGEPGTWTAAVALAPGRHRYAFVVDDTQWVTDPIAPVIADSGRPSSALFVEGSR